MAILQLRLIDAGGRKPYTNAAPATTNGEVVVYEQLQAAIQSIAWKDDVRAASVVNVTLATPGAAIDGVTLAVNDRVLLKSQTTSTENGIYVWNGAAVPLTRAVDADTFDELEAAIVTASEGTAGPAASETVSGIAEIATQAETDAGTDDLRIVTPLKLATYSGRAKRFNQTVGDGSATSITVTHNLGTKAVAVDISEVGGSFREVITEIQKTTTNSITVLCPSFRRIFGHCYCINYDPYSYRIFCQVI
jgi:hypothetical protein